MDFILTASGRELNVHSKTSKRKKERRKETQEERNIERKREREKERKKEREKERKRERKREREKERKTEDRNRLLYLFLGRVLEWRKECPTFVSITRPIKRRSRRQTMCVMLNQGTVYEINKSVMLFL